jgi:hypothetical protein
MFQEHVVQILRKLLQTDQGFLRKLAEDLRLGNRIVLEADFAVLYENGLSLSDPWTLNELPGILKEQIDDSGSKIVIRYLLGSSLYNYGPSLGFKEFLHNRGSGHNRLRTPRLSQPGALKVGDVLATGDSVLSEPREGGNGAVLIHLTGGWHGHWISVPARIPIALLTDEDQIPDGYIEK